MHRQNPFIFSVFSLIILIIISFACSSQNNSAIKRSQNYDDMVVLFQEFREFQKPKFIDGIPDYTAAAMEEQHRGLQRFQDRLAAIDISVWPVSQQVDYHLVRAEMNGLEFYHRVLHELQFPSS